MVASGREVVFTLKTALDPSVASGFSDIAQRAREAQATILQGEKSIQSASRESSIVRQQAEGDAFSRAMGLVKRQTAEYTQELRKQTAALRQNIQDRWSDNNRQVAHSMAANRKITADLDKELKTRSNMLRQNILDNNRFRIEQNAAVTRQLFKEEQSLQQKTLAALKQNIIERHNAEREARYADLAFMQRRIEDRSGKIRTPEEQQAYLFPTGDTPSDRPSAVAASAKQAAAGRIAAEEKVTAAAKKGGEERIAVEKEVARMMTITQNGVSRQIDANSAEAKALIEEWKGGGKAVGSVNKQLSDQEKLQVAAQKAGIAYSHKLQQLAGMHYSLLTGSMMIGRGVALMLSSNTQEAQKLMQKLFMIQGAFDAIKGSVYMLRGLGDAYKAYEAAVAAAAAAETVSTAATVKSTAAHAANAAATTADAVANQQLAAAQGMGTIGPIGRMAGRTMGAARGGFAAIGGLVGGGAMAGAGLVAGAAVGVYGAYRLGVMGAQEGERRSQERVDLMQAGINQRRESFGEGQQYGGSVSSIEQERRDAAYNLRRDSFSRNMAYAAQVRDVSMPNLGREMGNWSANRGELGRREPGAAEYDRIESILAHDRGLGEEMVKPYAASLDNASAEVAQRKSEQQAAEALAAQRNIESIRAQSNANNAQRAIKRDKPQWPGWMKRTGRFFTGNTTGEDLQRRAESMQSFATGAGEMAGEADSAAKAAQQATEDALKKQQELVEQTGAAKQVQAERDIKNAEEYIGKLKEMHEAHLRNADAIEAAGRALVIQLSMGKSSDRNKLLRAMEAEKAGTASDKQLALLANNASPEKQKQLEQEIERRAMAAPGGSKLMELKEYLGKGDTAAQAEKAKAADEKRRIEEQEGFVKQTKTAALEATDNMNKRMTELLTDLFQTQEKRFIAALEQLQRDFAARDKNTKVLSE